MFINGKQFHGITRFTMLIFVLFIGYDSTAFATEVCKAHHKGDLGELKNRSIIIDERIIAMSSEIKVKKPPAFVLHTYPISVFFILDNSSSMSWGGEGPQSAHDPSGKRFKLVKDLIDTIKAKFDSTAEVGAAVFSTYFSYNPVDNMVFVKCPGYDTGAYMPLLDLYKSYPPNGNTGYDIFRYYLDTTLTTQGNHTYIDLKYSPSQPFPVVQQNQQTCINAGFDAAKNAFAYSKIRKNWQYIIFLSDGEANHATPGDSIDKFIAGVNVPATFTVFFTSSTTPPANLQTMTNNIKNNGYSDRNPKSSLWSDNTDYPILRKFIADSVLRVEKWLEFKQPDSIVLRGVMVLDITDSVNSNIFYSPLFPLSHVKTTFWYRIKYTIFRQIINGNDTQIVPVDSVAEGKYAITVQQGAVTPDTFKVTCWNRTLGFYYNNQKITEATDSMSHLEIRFDYDSGTAKYNYSKVCVELITYGDGSAGKDKETFLLQKNGKRFSYVFPVEVTVNPVQNDLKLQVAPTDKIYAVFRNNETPMLWLDTLIDSIAYKTSIDINAGTSPSSTAFRFSISKTGNGKPVFLLQNLPIAGEIDIYTARGQCVFKKKIARGNAVLSFPAFKSSALYIFNLKYGATIINKKVIIP